MTDMPNIVALKLVGGQDHTEFERMPSMDSMTFMVYRSNLGHLFSVETY